MNQKEIRHELREMQKGAFHNNKLIPSNKIDLSSTRLNLLYQELHQLVLFGFANPSIVMCGVFLETLLKEILFSKGEYDYSNHMDFNSAIEKSKKYISKEDYNTLHSIRKNLRNPYQHHNLKQLMGEVKTKGCKLNTKTGKLTSWGDVSSDDLRFLETAGKLKYDGETFIRLFTYAHYLSKKLSKQYFFKK